LDQKIFGILLTHVPHLACQEIFNGTQFAEAPSFTYQFCCDLHRSYIDLDLYKNMYVVDTLNDLKP